MRRFLLFFSAVFLSVVFSSTVYVSASEVGILQCSNSVALPVALPGMTSEKTFEIVCDSDAPVNVFGIQQYGAFEVTNDIESIEFPVVLRRGEVLTVTLRYTPLGIETGSFGVLVIDSDASEPKTEVLVEAFVQVIGVDETAVEPEISIEQLQMEGTVLTVFVEANHSQRAAVQIVDVLGQVLSRQTVDLLDGRNSVSLRLSPAQGRVFVDIVGTRSRCVQGVVVE